MLFTAKWISHQGMVFSKGLQRRLSGRRFFGAERPGFHCIRSFQMITTLTNTVLAACLPSMKGTLWLEVLI